MKWLENMYEKCVQLLRNVFGVTYTVYLIRAKIFQPPGVVEGHSLFQITYNT